MERVNEKSCCRCYLYCQIFCGFGAGAVLEGEIGAEPSLRRPAGALERICMCAASCAVKSCSSFLVMEILKSRTAWAGVYAAAKCACMESMEIQCCPGLLRKESPLLCCTTCLQK
jgi:hypothetical protein